MKTRINEIGRNPFFGVLLLFIHLCLAATIAKGGEQPGHSESKAEERMRGPHNGWLLNDGDVQAELVIFETGVPPQFRLYVSQGGREISPKNMNAKILLTRMGEGEETYLLTATEQFLFSAQEVREPHSFSIRLLVDYEGRSHTWTFDNVESRTVIPDGVAKASGIKTERVQSHRIRSTARIRGKILPSEHRIAHIIPRFSGVVREGRKHIGDRVEKGEVLAIIESNQSLQPFEVRSQIAGTVINGHVIVGEFVPENQWIYVIADLSEVWADFFIPLREQISLNDKQKLTLSTIQGNLSAEGSISYVAPYADERSQSQLVRVVVPNPDSRFLPGMFVVGELVIREREVPLAIKKSGIQTFHDEPSAFVKVGETYEVRRLRVGVTEGEWVEILEGLSAGDEYVSENSFLIKADILKSGASHED